MNKLVMRCQTHALKDICRACAKDKIIYMVKYYFYTQIHTAQGHLSGMRKGQDYSHGKILFLHTDTHIHIHIHIHTHTHIHTHIPGRRPQI